MIFFMQRQCLFCYKKFWIILLCIRLFKYLVYLNAWILKLFFFCCCDLYYCNKNFIYIYKIVLEVGRGGAGPQGAGMGQGSMPRTSGRGGDGEGQQPCGAGTKIPSSGPAPPHCHPYSIHQNVVFLLPLSPAWSQWRL